MLRYKDNFNLFFFFTKTLFKIFKARNGDGLPFCLFCPNFFFHPFHFLHFFTASKLIGYYFLFFHITLTHTSSINPTTHTTLIHTRKSIQYSSNLFYQIHLLHLALTKKCFKRKIEAKHRLLAKTKFQIFVMNDA